MSMENIITLHLHELPLMGLMKWSSKTTHTKNCYTKSKVQFLGDYPSAFFKKFT